MTNKENKNAIGFFDSGVGGLSVYARFKKILPKENTIYYGDLAHLPYGDKTQKELVGYAKNILKFFANKQVKAVVIACNTSSAQAYDIIKDDFNFEIYPIIQSCAKSLSKYKRVAICATKATVLSGAYTREIKKYSSSALIEEFACPNWVNIVESGSINSKESFELIKGDMEKVLKFNPEKIVLGCTHYPYLIDVLSRFTSKENFVDPAEIFVNFIKTDLEQKDLLGLNEGNEEFFVSAFPEKFKENAKLFYEVKQKPQVVNY